MNKSGLAIIAVVVAAVAGIVLLKNRPAPAPAPQPAKQTAAAPQPALPSPAPATNPEAAQRASVIAVVDPREADETEGCGAIIHLIRNAKRDGVNVVELAPGSDSPLVKQHRIVVDPTVLVVEANGTESARFEGEDSATIKAIEKELQKQKERSRS